MKKNYIWITCEGPVSDSSYFINLKDKKQMAEDFNHFISMTAKKCQKVKKVDFVDQSLGAW